MKKVVITLTLFLISFAAFAYETRDGKVSNIQVNTPSASARNVIVWLEGVSQMCSIPSNNDSGYFNKVDSPDTFSAFVSTFLSAKAAGYTVRVLSRQGSEGCQIDRVEILNN